jgi:hypothetical protein
MGSWETTQATESAHLAVAEDEDVLHEAAAVDRLQAAQTAREHTNAHYEAEAEVGHSRQSSCEQIRHAWTHSGSSQEEESAALARRRLTRCIRRSAA